MVAPDGVKISVQEWGAEQGPELLFIHGFSLTHLCWRDQLCSELTERHRVITYDLRGHGGSDKPLDPRYYREPQRWADELKCVMAACGLKRPVLVAWSYGGRIVADYLAQFGDGDLGGINLVSVKANADPQFSRPVMASHQRTMASGDLETMIRGSIAFVEGCARHWEPSTLKLFLAMCMLTPAEVRAAMLDRPLHLEDYLRTIQVPVLFTHGMHDSIAPPEAARYAHSVTPNSHISIFESAGHAPFVEDATRFNAELAAFVRTCAG